MVAAHRPGRWLLDDWSQDDEALNAVNDLLRLSCDTISLPLRDLGVRYAYGVAVQRRPGKGLVLVATKNLPVGTVLVAEASLDVVPRYFYPRREEEIPPWLGFKPFFLLPPPSSARCSGLRMMEFYRIVMNSYGDGLFGISSLISHSCSPNVQRHLREDGLLAIFTCSSIQKGEEITNNYVVSCLCPEWLGGRLFRWADLFFRRGFWCKCERCAGAEQQVGQKLWNKFMPFDSPVSDVAATELKIARAVGRSYVCGGKQAQPLTHTVYRKEGTFAVQKLRLYTWGAWALLCVILWYAGAWYYGPVFAIAWYHFDLFVPNVLVLLCGLDLMSQRLLSRWQPSLQCFGSGKVD